MQVNEIFESISGEVGLFPQGSRATFIRLQGCNLDCAFCDAPESRKQTTKKGKYMVFSEILNSLSKTGNKNVVITGGEPLGQSEPLFDLIQILINANFRVSIETNGTFAIPNSLLGLPNLGWVMDYKLDFPDRMHSSRYMPLTKNDYVKFVIRDRMDMSAATHIHKDLYQRGCLANVAYSPVIWTGKNKGVHLDDLAIRSELIMAFLKKKKLPGILNLQIHKLINME